MHHEEFHAANEELSGWESGRRLDVNGAKQVRVDASSLVGPRKNRDHRQPVPGGTDRRSRPGNRPPQRILQLTQPVVEELDAAIKGWVQSLDDSLRNAQEKRQQQAE